MEQAPDLIVRLTAERDAIITEMAAADLDIKTRQALIDNQQRRLSRAGDLLAAGPINSVLSVERRQLGDAVAEQTRRADRLEAVTDELAALRARLDQARADAEAQITDRPWKIGPAPAGHTGLYAQDGRYIGSVLMLADAQEIVRRVNAAGDGALIDQQPGKPA